MNNIMIENLIFCIEKIPSNGQSVHEKNNFLMRLNLLKTRRSNKYLKRVTDSAIIFIIRESKKYDL